MEQRLWSLGYDSWDAVLSENEPRLPPRRFQAISRHIQQSRVQLEDHNAAFFAKHMPTDQHWRLFPEFRHCAAYLDIESTGLRSGSDTITTIALYDGRNIHYYVRGRNLSAFRTDIGRHKLLVTYNGKCFDIPFIEKYFDIQINAAHIDLRYVLKSLGYMGGLKGCEKQLGIDRGDLDGVDGYFAVLLWRDFIENCNERALETLLAYNIEDVVNLETLMVRAYNLKLGGTPFSSSHRHDEPVPPPLPFHPDQSTIQRLRRAYSFV
jgi:hypothetical protein